MRQPKALLDVAGEPFLARVIRAFRAAGCDPVLVVTGPDATPIEAVARSEGARPERNDDYESGQLTSLCAGIRALPNHSEAVLMTPVDHPLFDPKPIRGLLESAAGGRLPLAVPLRDGRRGHPIYIHRSVFAEFLALGPGATARDLIRADPARVLEVPSESPAFFMNLNEPDDLDTLPHFLP